MYGTIFNLSVKPGHEDELLSILNSQNVPDGGVAWLVLKPDENKSEWIGVAVFENKEKYESNANRPEQHEQFLRMMEHLTCEPTWTDGEYIINQIIQ